MKLFGGLGLGWSWRWVAEMEGGSECGARFLPWTGKLKMTTLLSETPAELETPRVE